MTNLYQLVRNETLKIWRKKRFFVILAILLVLIPMFTYAQMRTATNIQKQMGDQSWQIQLQQQIMDETNRLSSPRLPEEWRRSLQISINIKQYHLDQGVNPNAPNAVSFTRQFVTNAVGLFMPLLVLVVAADLVSAERSSGTIKLLLTRPVRRWKILLSKYMALSIYVTLIVLFTALISYLVSGLVFGYGGWEMPVLTGFQTTGGEVFTDRVIPIPQWQFIWMMLGLAWFSCWVVGCIAMLISVLVRSTPAGMGIMLALLIAGGILVNMVRDWEAARYFFMVNLQTIDYLSGGLPPMDGMTLGSSLVVLSGWMVASLIAAFAVFTRQDIYS